MSKKVYLFWEPFNISGNSREKLMIASLTKASDKNYIFKYEKDAIRAMSLGCFLPIAIDDPANIEKEIVLDSLPLFFSRRILPFSKFNIDKFGINYDSYDEFGLLTYGDGRTNSDNFSIIDEETYEARKATANEDKVDKVYSIRK